MKYTIIGPVVDGVNRGGHHRAARELQSVLDAPIVQGVSDIRDVDVAISVYNLDLSPYPARCTYRRVIWGPIDCDATDYATMHAIRNMYPYVDVYVPMCSYQYRMAVSAGIRATPPLRPPYRRIVDARRRTTWRDSMCIADDCIVYVAVGDCTPRKHIPMILDAYYHVRQRRPNTMLVIVSRGLLHLVPRDPDIYICGHGVDDIDSVYCGGDIYVSASGGEGWGYPAWDAAHSGLHLVLPYHTAYRELYPHYPRITYVTQGMRMHNLCDDRRYYVPDMQTLIDSMVTAYDSIEPDYSSRERVVDAYINTVCDLHLDFRCQVQSIMEEVMR